MNECGGGQKKPRMVARKLRTLTTTNSPLSPPHTVIHAGTGPTPTTGTGAHADAAVAARAAGVDRAAAVGECRESCWYAYAALACDMCGSVYRGVAAVGRTVCDANSVNVTEYFTIVVVPITRFALLSLPCLFR
jgi:hypothetical protein